MIIKTSLSVMLAFFLSGCGAYLINRQIDKDQNLTPEQIKAYNDVGLNLYSCFTVNGPPPNGAITFFLWPKDKPFNLSFSQNCQILTPLR